MCKQRKLPANDRAQTSVVISSFALLLLVSSTLPAQQIGVFTIPPASQYGPSTYTAYAYCTDSNGNCVPYCNPSVGPGYYQYTGGHNHEDSSHISDSYSGYVTLSGSNTNVVGLQATYHATRTGEREYITVCANTCSTTDAIIRNTNLQQLYAGYNFVLIGDKPWHPNNHFGYAIGHHVNSQYSSGLFVKLLY